MSVGSGSPVSVSIWPVPMSSLSGCIGIGRLRPAGWWAFGVFPGCSRVAAGDGGDGFIIAGGEQ